MFLLHDKTKIKIKNIQVSQPERTCNNLEWYADPVHDDCNKWESVDLLRACPTMRVIDWLSPYIFLSKHPDTTNNVDDEHHQGEDDYQEVTGSLPTGALVLEGRKE